MTSGNELEPATGSHRGSDRPEGADASASRREVHEAICDSILEIAPDVARDQLDAATDLHLDLGLDSIDLVNIAGVITERTGVSISDADYARLHRIGELSAFVADHLDRKP